MNKKELGIYVHIPFCKKKCNYCDFISFSQKEDKMEEYTNAIINEIKGWKKKIKSEDYEITTIYIGGGTPSYIPKENIQRIMQEINSMVEKINSEKTCIETTIEINPGTINKEKLELYKRVGINRISLGLQSTNDNILKNIGRIHTNDEFIQAYKLIRENGFNNCNVDLMIGLPNQTLEDIIQSLEEVLQLNPEHISIYSLILEEGTVLYNQVENGEVELPTEETERNMYWYIKNQLELNNYKQYEISNFSKEGFKSKHNWNCWKQEEYIGVGLAAHSYLDNTRFSNTTELEKYIDIWNAQKLDNPNNIIEEFTIEEDTKIDAKEEGNIVEAKEVRIIEEVQNENQKRQEYMILGLRTLEGISIQAFKNKFNANPIYIFKNELNKLITEGLILVDGDNIKLTSKGLDFANLEWEEFEKN